MEAKLSRRRTKTGCLTCRRRHIKCGEERPVCDNCMKSKRDCESCYRRVIFKSHQYDYLQVAHGGSHIPFQAGPVSGLPPSSQPACLGHGFESTLFTGLRPRQIGHDHLDFHDTFQHQQQYPQGTTFVYGGPPPPMHPMTADAMY